MVINVNFPDVEPDDVRGIQVTRQGFRDIGEMHAVKRTDLRGRDYYWMSFRGTKQDHPAGTDLRAMDEGKISVTPLHIDLTHMETVHALKGVLANPMVREEPKVGRNDPCPCGSNKKFKKCHGA